MKNLDFSRKNENFLEKNMTLHENRDFAWKILPLHEKSWFSMTNREVFRVFLAICFSSKTSEIIPDESASMKNLPKR